MFGARVSVRRVKEFGKLLSERCNTERKLLLVRLCEKRRGRVLADALCELSDVLRESEKRRVGVQVSVRKPFQRVADALRLRCDDEDAVAAEMLERRAKIVASLCVEAPR